MSEPQTENGFVRIANELFDAILRAPFSKRELFVVLAVIRKTYGYGKKTDDMTMTQLAEITGLARSHVSETVAALESKNVFLIRDGDYGKVIGLSKNYRNWNFTERPKTGSSQNGTRPKTGTTASQNGKRRVPKREITRTETGHTIDNPNRQLQKTTPKDSATGVTVATWRAYSAAYESRYGVSPIRNAKVSGQLANLVSRIGADEAPHVAAFYVAHNAAWYVKRGHSVDCLLADAEKLRTEWATSTQITDTHARSADSKQAQGDVWQKLLQEAENG